MPDRIDSESESLSLKDTSLEAVGAKPTAFRRTLETLTGGFAVAGGLLLIAVMAFTVISVVGRGLFNAPIVGDFEAVGLGCGIAVFAFLPYCHLTGGNVAVDLFIARLGRVKRAALKALQDIVFALVAGLITWRMAVGGLDLYETGETSMILSIPAWWGFPPAFLSGCLLVAACLYTAFEALREMSR